jgi:hypothetical protein
MYVQIRTPQYPTAGQSVFEEGMTHRKAKEALDTNQKMWERLGATIVRTHSFLSAELNTITFKLWFEKE